MAKTETRASTPSTTTFQNTPCEKDCGVGCDSHSGIGVLFSVPAAPVVYMFAHEGSTNETPGLTPSATVRTANWLRHLPAPHHHVDDRCNDSGEPFGTATPAHNTTPQPTSAAIPKIDASIHQQHTNRHNDLARSSHWHALRRSSGVIAAQ